MTLPVSESAYKFRWRLYMGEESLEPEHEVNMKRPIPCWFSTTPMAVKVIGVTP